MMKKKLMVILFRFTIFSRAEVTHSEKNILASLASAREGGKH